MYLGKGGRKPRVLFCYLWIHNYNILLCPVSSLFNSTGVLPFYRFGQIQRENSSLPVVSDCSSSGLGTIAFRQLKTLTAENIVGYKSPYHIKDYTTRYSCLAYEEGCSHLLKLSVGLQFRSMFMQKKRKR